jgi:hypothetical protein
MDITNIQPATNSEVGAVERHLEEHGTIGSAYVWALISRIKQQDRELDNLKQEMTASEAFYKVTVKERDYERVRCDSLQAELKETLKLAYIGDHHFPDLTYKARLEETVADLRKVQAALEETQRLLNPDDD